MVNDKIVNSFALVTGSSSGIGLEFARQLAQRGYPLILVSNEDKINDCARQLSEQYNVVTHALVRDLAKPEAPRELYDYCHEQDWTVEVLVNNAGVYHDRDILDTPAMLCYLFGQDMRERRRGYILNVCSVTSHIAAQRLGTYGSTKAFLASFTRALHIELKPFGVYVTNVSPGAVDTGLYSIPKWITQAGKCLGIIVSPQTLARRGLRALFHGRSKATIPCVFWKILCFIIMLIPTCLLRLIRRLGWF